MNVSAEFLPLAGLILTLGIQHGLDPDHLAAIDGMTRLGVRASSQGHTHWPRLNGVLFSLGHGSVVTAIAVALATLAQGWTPPVWLDWIGSWGAVAVVAALGVANLRAVMLTPRGEVVRMAGMRGKLFAPFLAARNPFAVLLVGGVIALSFDTVSQAAMLAAAHQQASAWQPALALGLLFTAGMLLTDGINGAWIARLLQHSHHAPAISRFIGVAISLISLLVAALGLARLVLPGVDAWSNDRQTWLGVAIICIISAGYTVVSLMSRRGRFAKMGR